MHTQNQYEPSSFSFKILSQLKYRVEQKIRIKKTKPIQKIVLNFNQNWLDIRMSSKILYLENQNRTEIFRVSEYIRTRFMYLNILIIFKFNM